MGEEKNQSHSTFELKTVIETSRMLVESRDTDFVLNNLLLILMGRLLVTKAAIFIHDPVEETYTLRKKKGFDKLEEGAHYTFDLGPEKNKEPYFEVGSADKIKPENGADLQNCFLFNLRTSNNHHGYLLLGPKANRTSFSREDLGFTESLCIISTAALVNSQLFTELTNTYRNLDRRIHELNTLFDLSKEFNLLVDREKISSIFKFALLGQLFIRTFFLIYKTGSKYTLLTSSGAVVKPTQKQINSIFLEADEDIFLVDENLKNQHEWIKKSNITALISVTIQNERVALIGVGERVNKVPFSESDYNFLKSLANLAVISIQKTFFLEERIDKERMEEELSIAKAIQEGLLPDPIPEIPGIDLAAKTVSSREVGGDYFDIAEAPDGSTIFAIADVTGKGVPAALLMANLQSMLHVLLPVEITLSEATDRINNIIHKNTPSDKFITFFWAKYLSEHKILRYVNAGHNPPLLLRVDSDEFVELTDGGLLLGAMETFMPYVQTDIQLNPGDLLVCYTDGIDETMNKSFEEYGTERLKSCILENRAKSSAEIMDGIVDSVKRFSGNVFSDDLTLLVLKACD